MPAGKRSKFLPYGRQFLAGPEYRAVRRVLKSRYLTQGPCVEKFEQALREVTGAPFAVAVANGTAALDLAVRAVKLLYGLKDAALALTTPNTFVASSNALLYNQLKPLFCDISAGTYNLSLREVQRLLESHNGQEDSASIEQSGFRESGWPPIELLLPVHFAGEPVDMPELWRLAHKYAATISAGKMEFDTQAAGDQVVDSRKNMAASHVAAEPEEKKQEDNQGRLPRLPIIEDAAHALGSYYGEGGELAESSSQNAVGSCQYSDACCFSFHPVKTVTTAEGGAITCRDPELHELLLLLRSHGINRSPELWLNASDNCENADLSGVGQGEPPLWYYEMHVLGHNARLSDVHAALGVEQLRRLANFAGQRRQLAVRYNEAFRNLSWLRTPQIASTTCPHLYVVQMDFGYLRMSRNQVMRELESQGIGSQVHYIPLPMQPFYRHLGYGMDGLENCRNYYRQALSLPLFAGMKPRDQDQVVQAIYRLAAP